MVKRSMLRRGLILVRFLKELKERGKIAFLEGQKSFCTREINLFFTIFWDFS
jgi:hypothetical protein